MSGDALDAAQELSEHAARAPTQRLRAELEDRTYAALPAMFRQGGIAKSLSTCFGWGAYEVEQRRALFTAGDAADALWDLSEQEGVAIGTLVRMLRSARSALAVGGAGGLAMAVAHEVRMFRSSRATEVRSADGSTHRRRAPSSSSSKDRRRELRERMWAMLEAHLRELMGPGAVGVDRVVKAARVVLNETLADIARDVEEARRLSDHVRAVPGAVDRRKLLDACRALQMEPPRPGEPADMEAARRSKRRLVKELHPDLRGGDEQTRPALEQVLAAFDLLKRHNSQWEKGAA